MRLGRKTAAPPPPPPAAPNAELLARRDRLVEKFTVMQADLGGLFYEMAVRDAIALDVLRAKAAELQRVDSELGQVERLLRTDAGAVSGNCPSCDAVYGRGATFCWQCGQTLMTLEAAS